MRDGTGMSACHSTWQPKRLAEHHQARLFCTSQSRLFYMPSTKRVERVQCRAAQHNTVQLDIVRLVEPVVHALLLPTPNACSTTIGAVVKP